VSETPPGRYGRRRQAGRRMSLPLIVAAVVFGIGALGLTWAYYQKYGQTNYSPEIIGWNEPSDTQMVIKFRVRVPAGEAASCVLRARDYQGFELGTRTIVVPAPSGGGEVVVAGRERADDRPRRGGRRDELPPRRVTGRWPVGTRCTGPSSSSAVSAPGSPRADRPIRRDAYRW
jgi:hypothetical protein